MKVQITLDEELIKRIDNYADENYMSRSGLISFACTQFLNSADVSKAIKDMAFCMRKIADSADKGAVTDEMMQELEDFDRLAKMLYFNQPQNSNLK